jgi:hypothetical protein
MKGWNDVNWANQLGKTNPLTFNLFKSAYDYLSKKYPDLKIGSHTDIGELEQKVGAKKVEEDAKDAEDAKLTALGKKI